MIRKPRWIRSKIPFGNNFKTLKGIVARNRLHTVCEEANCPNLGECWSLGTLTFMILGDTCTRSCGFCAVKTGNGGLIDYLEPKRLARGILDLKKNNALINHIVLTSVNRDNKNLESANIFANCINEIRKLKLGIKVEVLIPDFLGDKKAFDIIIAANPDVLNHNIETIQRLYSLKQETGSLRMRAMRPQADYNRSINLLKYFKKNSKIVVKSGFMVGVGETKKEIQTLIDDLNQAGCDLVTVGQYLQPTKEHIKVKKFYTLAEFKNIKNYASKKPHIKSVECGPMVRSSYHAESQLMNIENNIECGEK
ncbi:MAG: lipoyl synthase [Thermodesulfobacteriota bacterium]|mgnify:FL=1|nr:lipoyl synthase [Thermodesulfobacteriota bacterium]